MRTKINLFDIINYAGLTIFCLTVIYPLLYVLSVSLSDLSAVVAGKVKILPVGFNLEAYKYVLNDNRLLRAYTNTVFYASVRTIGNLVVSAMTAYPLSVATFKLKKPITLFYVFTMFFSGGLIPYYMLIRNLGLINTVWIMIIPTGVGVFNMIIYRTFFMGIPESLSESAYLDGANDMQILFKITMPLSKPLFAAMALFSVVGIWNDFFTALMFLNNKQLYPLQMLLREKLITASRSMEEMALIQANTKISPKTINCAMIFVVMLPVMCLYPFLQKHFAKGLMIGAVKG